MTLTTGVRGQQDDSLFMFVYPGTNNSYQLATNSPIARLYSTSTLERHHLNQALIILNLDGNRIFDNLSACEYTEVLSVIEEAILATDLSLHFAHLGRLKNLSTAGPEALDWEDKGKVSIAMAALMTASDLGATTKPWNVQKKVRHKIFHFHQAKRHAIIMILSIHSTTQ